MHFYTRSYIKMITVAVFIIVNKLWYIYMMVYYTAVNINKLGVGVGCYPKEVFCGAGYVLFLKMCQSYEFLIYVECIYIFFWCAWRLKTLAEFNLYRAFYTLPSSLDIHHVKPQCSSLHLFPEFPNISLG